MQTPNRVKNVKLSNQVKTPVRLKIVKTPYRVKKVQILERVKIVKQVPNDEKGLVPVVIPNQRKIVLNPEYLQIPESFNNTRQILLNIFERPHNRQIHFINTCSRRNSSVFSCAVDSFIEVSMVTLFSFIVHWEYSREDFLF